MLGVEVVIVQEELIYVVFCFSLFDEIVLLFLFGIVILEMVLDYVKEILGKVRDELNLLVIVVKEVFGIDVVSEVEEMEIDIEMVVKQEVMEIVYEREFVFILLYWFFFLVLVE